MVIRLNSPARPIIIIPVLKSPVYKSLSLITAALLALAFCFRLFFGLASDIWFIDQQQVYLIGLKFYATGLWPFFGPDVAGGIQLPGALQGLAVGLPLALCPLPESPYVLLALLSFGSLCLFAWYCSKRLPDFPGWIIYGWLLTAPWVMNWSTNIDNASYALAGSLVFFTGFLEAIPGFSLKLIRPSWAFFLMGVGLFWCAQFHLSCVILVPFALAAFYFSWKSARPESPRRAGSFLAGSLATGIFLIPTFWVYGLEKGLGHTADAVQFNSSNFADFFTILFRYVFLAACEIPRFIGANTTERWAFLKDHPFTAPFAVIAGILGAVQGLSLPALWFRKKHPSAAWPKVKLLFLLTFLLIFFSFLFSIKPPAAHTYLIVLPVAMLYGFYAFFPLAGRKWFRVLAGVLMACNLLFHAGLAAHNFKTKSLYKDRALFTKAIAEKNYHLLGERRADTLY
jgi:hypothetical protein